MAAGNNVLVSQLIIKPPSPMNYSITLDDSLMLGFIS